jgi:hypothetical protein
MGKINFINYDINTEETETDLIENSKSVFKDFELVNYNNVSEDTINYLPLHIRQPFGTEDIIKKIPNDIFLLMQQGVIRPLIIMVTEQWDLFDTFAWRHNKLQLTPDFGNVPYSKMIQHFTNRAVPEENITWLVPMAHHLTQIQFLKDRGYKVGAKFIQYDYFLEIMKPLAMKHKIGSRRFKNYFSCLCRGVPRNHRFGIVYDLWREDLLDKGNVSCGNYQELKESKGSNWIDDTITTSSFMNAFEHWNTNKDKFIENLPLDYDNKANQHWRSNYDESYIFNDSFLWIASETKKTHEGVYITEKTWKAIAYGSPFCINGDNGSLEYLKSMGFKTFSDYWDESYDEDNDIGKIKKITTIVKNICDKSLDDLNQLYDSMLPILKHNQQLLINNTQHQNLIKDLSKTHGIDV